MVASHDLGFSFRRSNGTRLVSATTEIRKIRNPSSCGTMCHMCFCELTISINEKEPAYISTPRIASPSEISYEMTWAEERSAPKWAYLEFDDQPDITGP